MSGPQFCGAGEPVGGSLLERAADVVGEGFFLGVELELFDLATDPEERTNLAEKQEEVIFLGDVSRSEYIYDWLEND